MEIETVLLGAQLNNGRRHNQAPGRSVSRKLSHPRCQTSAFERERHGHCDEAVELNDCRANYKLGDGDRVGVRGDGPGVDKSGEPCLARSR